MPIHLSYNQHNGVLTAECAGTLTLEDLRQVFPAILSSEEYSHNVSTLWDCRQLDFTTLDTRFAEQLIKMRSLHPERGAARVAIVVADDLGFGLSRMYELLSGGLPQHIRVFRDIDKACAWLQDGSSK